MKVKIFLIMNKKYNQDNFIQQIHKFNKQLIKILTNLQYQMMKMKLLLNLNKLIRKIFRLAISNKILQPQLKPRILMKM